MLTGRGATVRAVPRVPCRAWDCRDGRTMPFKDLGHHPEHMGHVVDHEHPDAIETGDARSCWGWPASGAHPLYAPWGSGLEPALPSAMSTSTSSSLALRRSARR